ncbi:hypothetical protein BFJ69_g14562 [Fusarium oxysporum]|uniref:PNPLA domain-containing protein n=1 Tax=Fusarium oxysporum TaxID=5507 RepID=A0A420MH71_FUSOX|nr:hypothetical protein BFJ69_g14562 [Fusarium oxysporum]
MSTTKRALLIASPFGGLQGPLNDVNKMTKLLKEFGFDIVQCCDKDATRDGIRTSWQNIIDKSSPGDTVVIYYSGHGGLVETRQNLATEDKRVCKSPNQYQFLVPMDFNETTDETFKGILDIEIAHLLRDTTNKSTNVTIILDCCHSGRMARDETHGDNATPKQLLEVQHHDLVKWVETLKQKGYLDGETAVEGNQDAVRIAASATRETAWEYFKNGQWGGIMTEALVRAMEETKGQEISWRTLLIRVRELVHGEFPQQHPRIEGPDTRVCFELTQKSSEAFLITIEEETAVLQAGRVAGVREGNKYIVMPFGSTKIEKRNQIAKATVTHIIGFKALVDLEFESGGESLPENGALAFLCQEALYEWPFILPEGLPGLADAVEHSKFLRRYNDREDPSHLAEFRKEVGRITLHTQQGVQIASRQILDDQATSATAFAGIIQDAEILAKAQHLLRLRCENQQEILNHGLKVEFGTVHQGNVGRPIEQDGSGFIIERDHIYLSLHNTGNDIVYVSVFDVNVAGKISLLSRSSPMGIELKSGEFYTLGKSQFKKALWGMPTTWPKSVPKSKRVDERLILVLSNAEVDLRHLNTSAESVERLAILNTRSILESLKSLEEVTYHIVTGAKRDVIGEASESTMQFDICEIPFSMMATTEEESEQRSIPAVQLPAPEMRTGWETLTDGPSHAAEKGMFGAGLRAFEGIPPCVWVVNRHSEEITVVVSKYRPNRLLSGFGFNASSTGGGANYTTTTFLSPATTKTLASSSHGSTRSMGVFPLWTRKGGFGVISIFTGAEKKLFIENDRIPIGATAYFTNEPDLTIVGYKENQINIPLPEPSGSGGVGSGLRLLSLDGGGIRGICSLTILDAIMKEINKDCQSKKLPKDCFDLAGGTSTGGLIALLLFRLELDTEKAIDVYMRMAKDIFSPRLPKLLGGYNLHEWGTLGYYIGNPYLRLKSLILPSSFSDYYLKTAINKVMEEENESGESELLKPGTTPMFMCATSMHDECAKLFRSYVPPPGTEDKFAHITVRDAALATSAAPTYLPKVKVMEEEFWDGGLLNNNPINQVWDARYELFRISESRPVPSPPEVSCIVSIGTGRDKMPVQQPGYGYLNTVSTVVSYATNTQAKHQDFDLKIKMLNSRSEGEEIAYFRFNVELEKEIGLDDWQSMPSLKAMTEKQLQTKESDKLIQACSNSLYPRS